LAISHYNLYTYKRRFNYTAGNISSKIENNTQ
jgi:hypothetical protein